MDGKVLFRDIGFIESMKIFVGLSHKEKERIANTYFPANYANNEGMNLPIHLSGDHNDTRILLPYSDINAKRDGTPDGDTPLKLAVIERSYYYVEFLVDNGADVNAIDKYGISPLHYAGAKSYRGPFQAILKSNPSILLFDKRMHEHTLFDRTCMHHPKSPFSRGCLVLSDERYYEHSGIWGTAHCFIIDSKCFANIRDAIVYFESKGYMTQHLANEYFRGILNGKKRNNERLEGLDEDKMLILLEMLLSRYSFPHDIVECIEPNGYNKVLHLLYVNRLLTMDYADKSMRNHSLNEEGIMACLLRGAPISIIPPNTIFTNKNGYYLFELIVAFGCDTHKYSMELEKYRVNYESQYRDIYVLDNNIQNNIEFLSKDTEDKYTKRKETLRDKMEYVEMCNNIHKLLCTLFLIPILNADDFPDYHDILFRSMRNDIIRKEFEMKKITFLKST